jgi:EAL and modified HD-GYP domain-containing signal transduction protein
MQHRADEMLYRAAPDSLHAQIDCGLTATVRACSTAFYEIGLRALVGDRLLFFNAPREWLLEPDLLPPSSDQLVIEVLESVTVDDQLLRRLEHLREQGYRLALDDFVLTEQTRPLLELADIIKVDMLQPQDPASLDIYKQHGVQLLAEKVEDMATFERCRAAGFDLFQGYFYARPKIQGLSCRRRESNQAAQIQLLNHLYRDNPDFRQLESLLVQDPELCVTLLRQVNSAAYHRPHPVSSIRRAITTLGLQRLKRLILTLLLARNGPASLLMLPQLLTRAAMCERLALHFGTAPPDEAFTVGTFSLIHTLLGRPRDALLDSLALDARIKHAIRTGEGELGRLLRLVQAHESARLDQASEELIDLLNDSYLHARSWATEQLYNVSR